MCLLLLAVISISFYCYDTMHYLRNENVCHGNSRNEVIMFYSAKT